MTTTLFTDHTHTQGGWNLYRISMLVNENLGINQKILPTVYVKFLLWLLKNFKLKSYRHSLGMF